MNKPNHPKFIDLTNQVINNITVVSYAGSDGRSSLWLCRCRCGNQFTAVGSSLARGRYAKCKECKSPTNAPTDKTCKSCNKTLPYTEEFFAASKQHRFGLRAKCRDCINASARISSVAYLRELRTQILTHYSQGNTMNCECCGQCQFEFLALDHLIGSSRTDYKRFDNSLKFFCHLKRNGYPPGFRVLCHNCNGCFRSFGACAHNPPAGGLQRRIADVPNLTPPLQFDGKSQKCIKCETNFPLTKDFFHRNKLAKSGFTSICRACDNRRRSVTGEKERNQERQQVFLHYANGKPQCICCNESHSEFLTIDHIDGGGKKHRQEINQPFYRFLVKNKFPNGYQVLCYNCNQSRGYYGFCCKSN